MSIKNLVEMIKRNGLLASMEQLEKLYQVAIENEQKLAESEARCAAMAAENARLKDLAMGWANATDDRLFEEHGEIFHDSIDACEEELKTICPATDAFLAEVRAHGVEMFAASLKVVGGGEHPYSAVANEFADQLRKGVQS
ncbi:hypothetical protein [Enterobacter roggenkampii]|uniref:hypothetical protein n=1 Tax=Enterobacter roggenkampii TaxID=1812935 RepID=UPI002017712D|nr:hypothetical protein [Enterobacter roggenkampii]